MHYQLFFQGKPASAAEALKSVGLSDFTDGARGIPVMLENVPGLVPGPCPGLLVGWGSPENLSSVPDRQTVLETGAGYHLVLWNDSKPQPEELARRDLFPGRSVVLADGNEWRVAEAASMPQGAKLVDGKWTKVRKPQFESYWRESAQWYRRWELFEFEFSKWAEDISEQQQNKADADGVLFNQLASFGCLALRQNYRLSPEIISALGLIDESSLMTISWMAVAGMEIKEVLDEKKRLEDLQGAGMEKKANESGTPDS